MVDSLKILVLSFSYTLVLFYWFLKCLNVLQMSVIGYKEKSQLTRYVFVSRLKNGVEILFGFTVLWTSREEMMSETSIEFVYKIKNESIFIGGKKSKNRFYGYLTEDWISRVMIEKYSLKALAITAVSARASLLSMMVLQDV